MSLRKCSKCGKEANTELELNLFKKTKKSYPYGRANICKKCHYKYYVVKMKKEQNKRRINFRGKQIYLKNNPRTNICSICGKNKEDNSNRGMSIHHIIYDDENPMANTIELCCSCHIKIHGLGTATGKNIPSLLS